MSADVALEKKLISLLGLILKKYIWTERWASLKESSNSFKVFWKWGLTCHVCETEWTFWSKVSLEEGVILEGGGGGTFSHKANQKNSDFSPSQSNTGSSTALAVIFLNASEKASDISESAWPRCGNRETKGAADVTFRCEGLKLRLSVVFTQTAAVSRLAEIIWVTMRRERWGGSGETRRGPKCKHLETWPWWHQASRSKVNLNKRLELFRDLKMQLVFWKHNQRRKRDGRNNYKQSNSRSIIQNKVKCSPSLSVRGKRKEQSDD